MQLYRLDMKCMDQERRQREEKIEKYEHDRECCHQELMMVLIASITGKQSIDAVHNNTNPTLVSPLSCAKNKRIPETISIQDQDKDTKIDKDELTVLQI
eukprot:2281512-Ditylum_brightwellii.AAC.1